MVFKGDYPPAHGARILAEAGGNLRRSEPADHEQQGVQAVFVAG